VHVPYLREVIGKIVQRHEALRTTFSFQEGLVRQIIHTTIVPPMDVRDLREKPENTWRLADLQRELSRDPFDLFRGPLFRCLLVLKPCEKGVLLISIHHLVADGRSIHVLTSELSALYVAAVRQRSAGLLPLPIQYADYSEWQKRRLESAKMQADLKFWRNHLKDAVPLELPAVVTRGSIKSFNAGLVMGRLCREQVVCLKRLAREEAVTPFVVLVAAFKLVLLRHAAQEDICIGTPVDGRTEPGLEPLIGFFVNTVVLRTDVSGDPTFRQLLGRVRESIQQALSHQEVPFDYLIRQLHPERHPARNPFFQVLFNLLPEADTVSGGAPARILTPLGSFEAETKFDLTMYARFSEECLDVRLAWRSDLFTSAQMQQFLDDYLAALGGAVAAIGSLLSAIPLATCLDSQQEQLPPKRGNYVAVDDLEGEGETTISGRFRRQAELTPHGLALCTENSRMTYAELLAVTEKLSHRIYGAIGGVSGRVGIVSTNDEAGIISIMAVLNAGCTYVPLDPSHPIARLQYIIEETGTEIILSPERFAGQFQVYPNLRIIVVDSTEEMAPSPTGVLPTIHPDTLAYILYTSGTTGVPKGVVQTHRNVLHHAEVYAQSISVSGADRLSLIASLGFDASVMDVFGALLVGACLCPFDVRAQNLGDIRGWLSRQQITVFHATPTVFRLALAEPSKLADLSTVRAVVLGGEVALPSDLNLFRQHFSPICLLVNGLGPTESTTALQWHFHSMPAGSTRTLPAGFPVARTSVSICNRLGQRVEPLAVGEIVIRSQFLSPGYWCRPELTAASFSQPDFRGERTYRTGDLARFLRDGAIEFVGRRDGQVKIRGQRVELAEIREALLQSAEIRDCAVILQRGNEDRLVACLVPRAGLLNSSEIQQGLRAILPEYMVPHLILTVPQLPLTANGKLNIRALEALARTPSTAYSSTPPRNVLEQRLLVLWRTVLGVTELGIYDNFFDLGGHSLLLIQLHRRIREAFGVDFALLTMFRFPSISNLSSWLAENHPHCLHNETIGQPA